MADYVIPESRRGNYYQPGVYQGVIGGIPDYPEGANIMDYGGDDTGVADNASALQAALTAAGTDKAVIIPEGVFAFTSAIIPYAKSRICIRGVSPAATTLKITGTSAGVLMGSGVYFKQSGYPNSTITGGVVKGSTVITVADATSFVTGRCAKVMLTNEAVTPILVTQGYSGVLGFVVWVVSKAGNNITIFPPIQADFLAEALSGAQLWQPVVASQQLVGVENLTIDGEAAGGVMRGVYNQNNTYQTWVKNVVCKNHQNYGICFIENVCAEIRGSDVLPGYGSGSNRSGLLANTCTGMLFEDNVTVNNFPGIEVNFATVGSIFAYNFSNKQYNINHGPHNCLNLYEGNKAPDIHADGYFGSISRETFFRNHVTRGGGFNGTSFIFKRATRTMNLVGNLVGMIGTGGTDDGIVPYCGLPNIGNTYFTNTAQPSLGDWWLDWDTSTGGCRIWTGTLTTRTDDTHGVITLAAGKGAELQAHKDEALSGFIHVSWTGGGIGSVSYTVSSDTISITLGATLPAEGTSMTITPSADGFQEKDLDVVETLLRKANYFFYSSEIPSGESIGSDTLAASMFRSAKPGYFQALEWPPYDPFDAVRTVSANRIPAECRYNGVDYSGSSGPSTNSIRLSRAPLYAATVST